MPYTKNKSKLYVGILIGFIALMAAAGTFLLLIYPSIYENDCKTRVYADLESKLDYDVMSSNICIVQCRKTDLGSDTVEYTYSAGASGVIYEKKDDKYFALTAYHVIEEMNNVQFIVQPYGSVSFEEAGKNAVRELSLIDYYNKFPKGKVEYYDREWDLAIISFNSDKDLGVLDISSDNIREGDRVAVIGNPEGTRFSKTYGNITSNVITDFKAEGSGVVNKVQCHSAFVAPGSSGGAVLNEDMEIVGINIGGGTNFRGKFQYGAMVPCSQVRFFVGESKKYV
ncbi:MAG: serine protease [Firmicutes bacterium]|nr:serine protease [Bacillota bacterium]